jgi:hypothetical protein
LLRGSTRTPAPPPPQAAADYVGAKACAACHAQEHKAWLGSHHQLAMQEANASTVLGNFDDAKFKYSGIESRFFKRDGKFMVRADGPDGKLTDFEIKYTFGVTPLQQYLIEFLGGRYQSLAIAWDTRTKEQGEQRWFLLYPNEKIDHKDPLHWAGLYQNWNLQPGPLRHRPLAGSGSSRGAGHLVHRVPSDPAGEPFNRAQLGIAM